MEHIFSTEHILKDLDEKIKLSLPFSTIRLGDAGFGILLSFFCPEIIHTGKWSGEQGKKLANKIMHQLTIPIEKRSSFAKKLVDAVNNATYCDSSDVHLFLNDNPDSVGLLAQNWKQIHKKSNITNKNYCSAFLHYFSIVKDEFNLFDIMKGKKIFCISNQVQICEELKANSKISKIDFYKIPRQKISDSHYIKHYNKVVSLIEENARNYDLFLIGGGFLGKIYCDHVKRNGGRAFDTGRLFDIWASVRILKGRPAKFLKQDLDGMLAVRFKEQKFNIW